MSFLSSANSSKILVLDGGLSNALRKYVKNFDVDTDPLWTARALLDSPNAVLQAHLDYLNAGADIIATGSYQATVPGFSKYMNLDALEAEALIKKSVTLAKEAVDQFLASKNDDKTTVVKNGGPFVAGSVGPYGAFLCDRSEYTGKYMDVTTDEQLAEFHLPRLRALIEGGTDLIMLETMPAVREVKVVLELLTKLSSPPTVVSFSTGGSGPTTSTDTVTTAYGDDLRSILEVIRDTPTVIGFGINCCSPETIESFLKQSILEASTGHLDLEKYRLVVYPNSGNWVNGGGTLLEGMTSVDTYVNSWISAGASIIGGCCQVGPREISEIRKIVDTRHDVNLS